MSHYVHAVRIPKGALPWLGRTDSVLIANLPGRANAAGGSAGASVSTNVSGLAGLPANYSVLVNPGQDASWYITNKTSTGFTVVLTPNGAANTLAAGTFDAVVIG